MSGEFDVKVLGKSLSKTYNENIELVFVTEVESDYIVVGQLFLFIHPKWKYNIMLEREERLLISAVDIGNKTEKVRKDLVNKILKHIENIVKSDEYKTEKIMNII